VTIDAVQAGSYARGDERAYANEGITEEDGQVRNVAA
jgi:hypothetical protein